MFSIVRMQLPISGFDLLRMEARTEGYNFIDRMTDEWESGANRFDQDGEALFGGFEGRELIAIGGLNRDPYVDAPEVGRLRRIYVRPAWRGRGVGHSLVETILAQAREQFRVVRLRAENPAAARLYERAGLKPIQDPHATHMLVFDEDRLL